MKCWSGVTAKQFSASPLLSAGSGGESSSAAAESSSPSIYSVRKPANFSTEPDARNSYRLSLRTLRAAMSTRVESKTASVI